MKELFSETSFSTSKSRALLPLECYTCGKTFLKTKNQIQRVRKGSKEISLKYCCRKCFSIDQNKQEKVSCINCNTAFLKRLDQIKKYPKHFCSNSCSATFNNKNKKYGTRRSKLEEFLEQNLPIIFSNLSFEFNSKTIIGSELDIFIPEISLAFEINGIFHYKPIFGEEKLAKIKNNDRDKVNACRRKNIKLHKINVSKLSHFNENNAKPYLNKIIDKINNRLGVTSGN